MIENGFLICPNCKNILQKVSDKKSIIDPEAYCRTCKAEYDLILANGELVRMKVTKEGNKRIKHMKEIKKV